MSDQETIPAPATQPAPAVQSVPSAATEASAFWPVLLMALSLATILTWNVLGVFRQRDELVRTQEMQRQLSSQAVQEEEKMRAIMVDLLDLAREDRDAQAIVQNYKIVVNNPAPAGAVQTAPPPAAP